MSVFTIPKSLKRIIFNNKLVNIVRFNGIKTWEKPVKYELKGGVATHVRPTSGAGIGTF